MILSCKFPVNLEFFPEKVQMFVRKWLRKLDSKGLCVNVKFPEKDPKFA